MAIKAGRVGVAPSQVDIAGNITGAASGYTKAEADEKFATKSDLSGKANTADVYSKTAADDLLALKVPTSQLNANSKDFYFAYDSTSQKYGYKAGSDGDFVPFESAGGPGWVAPAELVTTGITYGSTFSYVDGGYYFDSTNKYVYIDIRVSKSSAGSTSAVNVFTLPSDSFTISANYTILAQREPGFFYPYVSDSGNTCNINATNKIMMKTSSNMQQGTYHIWGKVAVAV